MSRRRPQVEDDSRWSAHWHLDKRVSIATVATFGLGFVVQTAVLVWVVSNALRDISELKEHALKTSQDVAALVELKTNVEVMKTEIRHVAIGQGDLKASVDRLIESASRRASSSIRPKPNSSWFAQ